MSMTRLYLLSTSTRSSIASRLMTSNELYRPPCATRLVLWWSSRHQCWEWMLTLISHIDQHEHRQTTLKKLEAATADARRK
ncbi:hypothetical protein VTN77DRAFT_8747 [Rasamsonia byssochlamydoides]|uniref:uncharacterized protein n=1 Tax=Rasamsonia byssochlamydoides TaxID=89139 RepID=UPI0037436577